VTGVGQSPNKKEKKMETGNIVIAIVVLVFFVLALVAIFRYDKVKNTFEGLGLKLGITGSRGRKRTKEDSSKNDATTGGKSSIKIGGKVSGSNVSSISSGESDIDIKKDVEKSKVRSKGG
jgi:hypothetical protein